MPPNIPVRRQILSNLQQRPTIDFLAPAFIGTVCSRMLPREFSSLPGHPSAVNTSSGLGDPRSGPYPTSDPAPLSKPLTQAQREFLTSALRVNQAGELAATRIYAAQTPPLIASHPQLRPLMKHMYDQEAGHFKTFNHLLAKHRIRPTAMYPLWTLAASTLGWTTAVMGREAAMACTEAVETEIGSHYNGQVRILLDMLDVMEKDGEEMGEDLKKLVSTIRRIRDEELEHLDHAVKNDAQQAVPHALLTGVIRAGCRGAIWVSERV